ncbi:DUF1592 domain-containing protein [bacterium]|nr:DUF1592 domain-containing protein [bacterium]
MQSEPTKRQLKFPSAILAFLGIQLLAFFLLQQRAPANEAAGTIRMVLTKHCIGCHNADDRQGELDLNQAEIFQNFRSHTNLLQQIRWQINNGEMPPQGEPELNSQEKAGIIKSIDSILRQFALENAGDPGPVVLRRLSNREYTYTVRDLTGIKTIDPTKEFPVDGAAGEGFTNVGSALVMSPGLLTKYLEAAKEIASHAMILPDRIEFSPSTSRADWTQEKIETIRSIYALYAVPGNLNHQNLPGVQVSSVDAAVIPLHRYIQELLSATVGENNQKTKAFSDSPRRLSEKYLGLLENAASEPSPSALIREFQERLRNAPNSGLSPQEQVQSIVSWIQQWQSSLWHFGKVGHIGKRDGPIAWQMPVMPIATKQAISIPLQPSETDTTTLSLIVNDAGDGIIGDRVRWNHARLEIEGHPDLALSNLKNTIESIELLRSSELSRTSDYLSAILTDIEQAENSLEAVAERMNLVPEILQSWWRITGRPQSTQAPQGHRTDLLSQVGGHDAIRGWGKDLPTLLANSSEMELAFSTLRVPARAVTVHPTPEIAAIIYWQSPIDGIVSVNGLIADMDSVCGNGVAWNVDWIHRNGTQQVEGGAFENGQSNLFQHGPELHVRKGDLLRMTIESRDRNHTCDTTQISMSITEVQGENRKWDLAEEIVDRINQGNPLSDRYGNPNVWHFCQATQQPSVESLIHPNSTLANYLEGNRSTQADDLQKLSESILQPDTDADRTTSRWLMDPLGPLAWLRLAVAGKANQANEPEIIQDAGSTVSYEVPTSIAKKAKFIADASIDPNAQNEGSVQIVVTFSDLGNSRHLIPGELVAASDAPGTAWTAGQPTMVSNRPILVHPNGSGSQRIRECFESFQNLFPAAVCYSKIVPVDEVVTLTLRHREDEKLIELMLDQSEMENLEQQWNDLWFVSRHALQQQDAFDQLWQFATQDADPSAFDPMREPIQLAVDQFRETLERTAPQQLDAVISFADQIWRHPLTREQKQGLAKLYEQFRDQELDHEEAIRLLITRLFVAPDFLYRMESPARTAEPQKINDWELANRLSYFLWSSSPDTILANLAMRGELSNQKVLAQQTKRMLQDQRIRRLAVEFGCQWLGVRSLGTIEEKNERQFPEFKTLRADMEEEITRFWIDLFQNDRSPYELLNSKITFVNPRLSAHYGLEPLQGDESEWHQITNIQSVGRGGVLGFAGTLAKQSGASRTSPILRGNWVSETLLGERLPKPPKDVPVLPEEMPPGLTERQMIEQHSSNPQCSKCHRRIDPFGFALENFDAVGRIRSNHDTKTQLPDGTIIGGIEDLRHYLVDVRGEEFLEQFCRKLLGYALGRSVQLSDQPLIDEIKSDLRDGKTSIESAMIMITQSKQFTHVRGRPATSTPQSFETKP